MRVQPVVHGVDGTWVSDRDLFVLLAKTFGCTVQKVPTAMVDIPPPEPSPTVGRRRIPRPGPPRVLVMRQLACVEETFRVRAGGKVWMWADVVTVAGDQRWHMGQVVARGVVYHQDPPSGPDEAPPEPRPEAYEEVGIWWVPSSRSMGDQLAVEGVACSPEPAEEQAV